MNIRILILVVACMVILPMPAHARGLPMLYGMVYGDWDGDGHYDEGEPWLTSTPITVGGQRVTTDQNGMYYVLVQPNQEYLIQTRTASFRVYVGSLDKFALIYY